jgi:uncharacterized protein (TIGR02598 family)
MSFFPQPTLAHPESPKLRAKQSHAKSATFALKKHSHFRTLPRLNREFAPSHLSIIQHQKFNTQNHGLPPLIPRRPSAAFSLTEVVIAMGVAAVAFTSIIALFPLGLSMSRESYEETQSALIAHTILADLKDEAGGTGPWSTKRLIQTNANSSPANTANYLAVEFNIALTEPQIIYVAYNQVPRTNSDTDPTGQTVMLRPYAGSLGGPPNWYTRGTNGAVAMVKITINKTFCINGTNATSGDPRRVDVSVETPGSAPSTNRTTFLYTGIVPPG